jgi:hypothetical protein
MNMPATPSRPRLAGSGTTLNANLLTTSNAPPSVADADAVFTTAPPVYAKESKFQAVSALLAVVVKPPWRTGNPAHHAISRTT